MDRESFFRAIMAAAMVFLLWMIIFSPRPPAHQQSTPVPAQEAVADSQPAAPHNMEIRGADTERTVELGNVGDSATSEYPFHLTLSNRGAALVSARLTEYAETVKGDQRYELLQPVEVGSRTYYSLSTDSVSIGSGRVFRLDDELWHLADQPTPERVRFWIEIAAIDQPQPLGRLTKTYSVKKQSGGHSDLVVTFEYHNFADDGVQLVVVQRGPTGLPQEDPRSDFRKISAGISESGQFELVSQANTRLKPDSEFAMVDARDSGERLSWAALSNKFFAVIVAPQSEETADNWVNVAAGVRLADVQGEKDDSTFELSSKPFPVPAGETASLGMECYLGPKSKNLFTADPLYHQRHYVALVEDDYYWCAWGPVVNVMLWLLNTSHAIIPNYGVAIIIMVLIVRTLLHPLTKKGQVNMTRMAGQMAELQPKMEEIKKKYANDRTRMNQETMKLYQTAGVNPAGQMMTCLPMMLQMPIWGALWAALNFTVELRHQPFIWWIQDLTAPDAAFTLSSNLPLIGNTINVLPPLLGIGMWLQQRLMPKPATAARQHSKTTDQMAQQRLMMTFMSVFFVFIFYSAPSGLTLYIMSSNFFGLIEQHRIRKHIKDDEQRRGPGGSDQPSRKLKKPRFLERLEKMADEARQR